MYYVNTWNQEIRWIKPLEISLFESRDNATSRPGTGNSSRLSRGDEEDDDEGGVATIGDRFRQRLVELTGEATMAAEEEERFVRHVAANIATITATGKNDSSSSDGTNEGSADGTDRALALTAAREWRFVSTDKRLLSSSSAATAMEHKCWYHAGTSEYFWGNNPPLLGLLLCLGDGVSRAKSEPLDGVADSSRIVGGTVGGDGSAGPTGTVHPELGLVFSDRASGEAWLKTQDLGPLLARSVRVCDIGPAGWCQLRAAVPSNCTVAVGHGKGDSPVSEGADSSAPATASTVPEDSAAPAGAEKGRIGIDIHGGSSTGSAARDNHETVRNKNAAAAKVGEKAPTTVLAVNIIPITTAPDDGGTPLSLSPFTFFHHADTGEVRWCLSPRSALLATPRTSRREASYARRLSAAAGYNHIEPQQQHGWAWDGSAGAESDVDQPGGVAPGGRSLALVEDNTSGLSGSSGDDWEVVEDGDMIFYYNKRLGVSTWEPPPEWEQRIDQELYGAGG